MTPVIRRMTAFPAPDDSSAGIPLDQRGNPAGVVLDATGLTDADMLGIAAELGYSETAFVIGGEGGRYSVRYFTPTFEIPFCGHATVATAVALAEAHGPGPVVLDTPVGPIALDTDDQLRATFTSVEPVITPLEGELLAGLLGLLGLTESDLDERYPARQAFAGNTHPVVVVRDAERFDTLDYDPALVRGYMDAQGWGATVTVLHALDDGAFEARNLFPVGGIREDPATGSAAAAVGGWLREIGAIDVPAEIVIHQGRHVGRPSLLRVRIPALGGIAVTGTATAI